MTEMIMTTDSQGRFCLIPYGEFLLALNRKMEQAKALEKGIKGIENEN